MKPSNGRIACVVNSIWLFIPNIVHEFILNLYIIFDIVRPKKNQIVRLLKHFPQMWFSSIKKLKHSPDFPLLSNNFQRCIHSSWFKPAAITRYLHTKKIVIRYIFSKYCNWMKCTDSGRCYRSRQTSCWDIVIHLLYSVADPGFPVGGAWTS